jgi:hypothetical protein
MNLITSNIPKDLLEELESLYDYRLPIDLNFSEREVAFRMGQSQVIQLLRLAYEEQNETIIGD